MEEWKEYKLGDVAGVKGGKRLPKGVNLVKEPNTHPYIRVRDLGTKRFIELDGTYEYVDDETQKSIARYIVNTGDIIISIVGTIGLTAIIGESLNYANLTENCVKLINIKGLNRDYLYYYLISDCGKQEIERGIVGAVQAKLPIKNIQSISIKAPSLETQKRIASILSSLDDKIEVNRKINENLEQQAQALFKSWFVDFEPFKDQPFVESELGMIPEGWRVEPLANIMNFQEGPGIRNWQYVQNGGTKFINIRCIKDGDIYTETANMISNQEANGKYAHFMLQSGDIVMSCSGTLGRYAIVREDHLPLCLNTSVIRFIPISNFDYSFVLGTLTSSYFLNKQIEMACGSVQANFGPTHLKQMKILVPPEAIRTQYNEKCYPIIHLIQKQKYESRRLAELRDTLLPKLMSGELKVSDI